MARKTLIPMHYKFLLPTIIGTGAAFVWSLVTIETDFRRDKQYFAAAGNAAVLRSAVSELNAAFKLRFFEVQSVLQRLQSHPRQDPYLAMPSHLREEILRITLYRPRGAGWSRSEFGNRELLEMRNLDEKIVAAADKEHPIDVSKLDSERDLRVFNRSVRADGGEPQVIYSLALFGKEVDGNPRQTIIIADLLGDFVRRTLRRSELTEVFFLNQDGTLFAHPSADRMVEFADRPWNHPAMKAIGAARPEADSYRWNVGGDEYSAAVSPSTLPKVYAVSQTSDADSAGILTLMRRKSALAVFAVWCLTSWLVVFLGSRISRRLKRIALVLEDFTAGHFGDVPKVKALDEVAEVAFAMEQAGKELPRQIDNAVARGRQESEMALAETIHAALGPAPQFNANAMELVTHRPSGVHASVDFWDSYLEGHMLTLIFGRTNDAGVSAAMFGAYAKSCLVSLRTLHARVGGQATPLAQQAKMLSDALYLGYKGRHTLLVTMIEIDTHTGQCQIINAGTDGPICLSPAPDKKILMHKELIAPSSPIGATPEAVFTPISAVLEPGEMLFLYAHTRWHAIDVKDANEARQRLKQHVANAYHPTPQAMRVQVNAQNPFGDEMAFWILEWKSSAIGTPTRRAA